MKHNKIYKMYSDPGHGWMAVKRTELVELGIEDKISLFSYVSRSEKTVYLEEDRDMALFLQAFEAKFNVPPRYETIFHNGMSPIRSLYRYGYKIGVKNENASK